MQLTRQMWNMNSFFGRRFIAAVLLLMPFLFCARSVVAQAYPPNSSSGSYDSSQTYSQQDLGLDALRARCSGPDAGPECAALSGGSTAGMPGLSATPGVPQIYSNEQSSPTDRFPYSGSSYPHASVLKPEPPTEFQKLVYESIGQRLPIFGSNLFFRRSKYLRPDRPCALFPPTTLLVQAISWWCEDGGRSTSMLRATVDRSGNIYIPKVGVVNVTGVKYSELAPYLKGVISRNFPQFRSKRLAGSTTVHSGTGCRASPSSGNVHGKLTKHFGEHGFLFRRAA